MDKQQILKRHKLLATGLFVLMALIFAAMLLLEKYQPAKWIGYVKAFSEAAMVGALADWFAVTALFKYPLGLKIPHTNLIENRKNDIGENLGTFVVDNFLTPQTLRPYVKEIAVTKTAGNWLLKNKQMILNEVKNGVVNYLETNDLKHIKQYIAEQSTQLVHKIPVENLMSNALNYLIENREQDKALDYILQRLNEVIKQPKLLQMVQEKVDKKFFSLLPNFASELIASYFLSEIQKIIDEVRQNPQHKIRREIDRELSQFVIDLHSKPQWKDKIHQLKQQLITVEILSNYTNQIVFYLKNQLINDLNSDQSNVLAYIDSIIENFAVKLSTDKDQQEKIDGFVRKKLYHLALKNNKKVGQLISNTVESWEGKSLSEKLELEVGKDLQFIRINGTLVGGMVGLMIYTLVQLFF